MYCIIQYLVTLKGQEWEAEAGGGGRGSSMYLPEEILYMNKDTYEEIDDAARLPAQLAGR
jgi:hypothetical protein